MHEQSTLAKLRRPVIGCAARLAGPRAATKLPLTQAERCAVDWHAARQSAPARADHGAGNAVTTFAIPLVGRHQVGDWTAVETVLQRCLSALQAQSNPAWRVVICSQTRPDVLDGFAQASFLPFTTQVSGHDKAPKLAQLAQHCLQDTPQAGFFMPLDGDDLLHRDFVAQLHSRPDQGVLVSSGAMLNAATGQIARTAPRSLRAPLHKPFWKFCGSCMALPTGSCPEQEAAFFTALAQHEHRLYPHLAAMAGLKLHHSTDPLALYVINHGENFETRRGRGGFKQRFVTRFEERDQRILADLKAGFPDLDLWLNT